MKKLMLMTIALIALAIPSTAANADGQRIIPRLERGVQDSANIQSSLPPFAWPLSAAPLNGAEQYILDHNAKGDGR